MPPSGYLAWHEWAEVQHKAGLKQKECGRCGKFFYPQELINKIDVIKCMTTKGKPHKLSLHVCVYCDSGAKEQ